MNGFVVSSVNCSSCRRLVSRDRQVCPFCGYCVAGSVEDLVNE